jgi:hypothetical protein
LAAPAPRLDYEAVEEFELEPAHPARGAWDAPGQVVEHAADADADRDAERAEVAVQP